MSQPVAREVRAAARTDAIDEVIKAVEQLGCKAWSDMDVDARTCASTRPTFQPPGVEPRSVPGEAVRARLRIAKPKEFEGSSSRSPHREIHRQEPRRRHLPPDATARPASRRSATKTLVLVKGSATDG
jgi:hypothetical protein